MLRKLLCIFTIHELEYGYIGQMCVLQCKHCKRKFVETQCGLVEIL